MREMEIVAAVAVSCRAPTVSCLACKGRVLDTWTPAPHAAAAAAAGPRSGAAAGTARVTAVTALNDKRQSRSGSAVGAHLGAGAAAQLDGDTTSDPPHSGGSAAAGAPAAAVGDAGATASDGGMHNRMAAAGGHRRSRAGSAVVVTTAAVEVSLVGSAPREHTAAGGARRATSRDRAFSRRKRSSVAAAGANAAAAGAYSEAVTSRAREAQDDTGFCEACMLKIRGRIADLHGMRFARRVVAWAGRLKLDSTNDVAAGVTRARRLQVRAWQYAFPHAWPMRLMDMSNARLQDRTAAQVPVEQPAGAAAVVPPHHRRGTRSHQRRDAAAAAAAVAAAAAPPPPAYAPPVSALKFALDQWVQLYDEATRKMFFYNVATGERQWETPLQFVAFGFRVHEAAVGGPITA